MHFHSAIAKYSKLQKCKHFKKKKNKHSFSILQINTQQQINCYKYTYVNIVEAVHGTQAKTLRRLSADWVCGSGDERGGAGGRAASPDQPLAALPAVTHTSPPLCFVTP